MNKLERVALLFKGKPKDYKHHSFNDLNYLDNNISEVENVLKNHWHIHNHGKHELNNQSDVMGYLKELSRDIKEILIYYAGHGFVSRDTNKAYHFKLVGYDDEFISLQQILQDASSHGYLKNKKIAIVVDACHSGIATDEIEKYSDFEIVTATDHKVAYKDGDKEMSFFTSRFIEYLTNPQGEIFLKEIVKNINNQENSSGDKQYAKYSYVESEKEISKIVVAYPYKDTIRDLETILRGIGITKEQLNIYAYNLLSSQYDDLNFDTKKYYEVLQYLYDHRTSLFCLLKQLRSFELNNCLEELKKEFHYSDDDIKNFPCISIDMKRVKCNLLINLTNIGSLELSNIEATIYEYRANKIEDKGVNIRINLAKDKNPQDLVDKNPQDLVDEIFKIIDVSSRDVLLEFILPQELISQDVASWSGCNGKLGDTFYIVKRLQEREYMVKKFDYLRNNWNTFWDTYYKSKKEEPLAGILTTTTSFRQFEEKPYLKLKHPLKLDSDKVYKKLLLESACIVLLPIDDNIDKNCKKLESLIPEVCEKPHILIWDNPKRALNAQNKPVVTGE